MTSQSETTPLLTGEEFTASLAGEENRTALEAARAAKRSRQTDARSHC